MGACCPEDVPFEQRSNPPRTIQAKEMGSIPFGDATPASVGTALPQIEIDRAGFCRVRTGGHA
jgi:hypothetical protein